MNPAELPEELITLVEVIAENDSLAAWFEHLKGVPVNTRIVELQQLESEMAAGGEEEGVVEAVRLLAHPRIFQGASAAVDLARHR